MFVPLLIDFAFQHRIGHREKARASRKNPSPYDRFKNTPKIVILWKP